VTGVSIQVSIG